jgi:hypothetical protein
MTRKDRYCTLAVGRGIPSNEPYLFEIILVSQEHTAPDKKGRDMEKGVWARKSTTQATDIKTTF